MTVKIFVYTVKVRLRYSCCLAEGPHIKYVEGSGAEIFTEFMKYFRHLLMGHEIFFENV